MSQPLQISADTAIKLSKQLGIPIEHLMHMPKHILLQSSGSSPKPKHRRAQPLRTLLKMKLQETSLYDSV